MGRTEPNRWTPKKLGKPPRSRRARSVSATASAAASGAIWRPRTTIWNRFPARSPISRPRSDRKASRTSRSFRRMPRTDSGGTPSKEKRRVVIACLSFVPANPIRRRLMWRIRANSRMRRLVSHLRTRIWAIVKRPSADAAGGDEISSTTKSSGDSLMVPPTAGVDVRYPTIPTSRSMGLCELLLQELLRAAELRGQALRDSLQRSLGAALLHRHRQDGLVQLRVARVVQCVLDVGIFEQRRDQRVDHRVVRVQDLQAKGIFLFLEKPQLHGRLRSGCVDLRLCGTDSDSPLAVVVNTERVPEWVPHHARVRGKPLHPDVSRLEKSGGLLEIFDVEIEWSAGPFRTIGDLGQLPSPPQGDLPALRFNHRPHGAALPDDPKSTHVAIELEGFGHVVDRENQVAEILDDCHPRSILPGPY